MLQPDHSHMSEIVRDVGSNTSEKIRLLVRAGFKQADVARFLEVRDQFVSNVVRNMKAKLGTACLEDPQPVRTRLNVDSAGRIVIPVEFRRAMNIGEGGELMARMVDGELRVMSPTMAVKRAQKLVREMIPGDAGLADSLIADRRREAVKEAGDG